MRSFDDLTMGELEDAERAGLDLTDREAVAAHFDISQEDAVEIDALLLQFRALDRAVGLRRRQLRDRAQ
jgi:hypothetical protein